MGVSLLFVSIQSFPGTISPSDWEHRSGSKPAVIPSGIAPTLLPNQINWLRWLSPASVFWGSGAIGVAIAKILPHLPKNIDRYD